MYCFQQSSQSVKIRVFSENFNLFLFIRQFSFNSEQREVPCKETPFSNLKIRNLYVDLFKAKFRRILLKTFCWRKVSVLYLWTISKIYCTIHIHFGIFQINKVIFLAFNLTNLLVLCFISNNYLLIFNFYEFLNSLD